MTRTDPTGAPGRRRGRLPVAVVGALALAACGGAAQSGPLRGEAEPLAVDLADAPAAPDVVAATDAIGAELLGLSDAGGTTVVSPASMSFALGMLGEGASGDGVTQMDALLGSSGQDRLEAYAALRGSLAPLDGDVSMLGDGELPDEPVLHLAAQVALAEDTEVPAEYLDRVAEGFDAGVARGDLASQEGVDALLGEWVRENTGGLIEESAIQPSSDLRLVLQDAVVLGARWQTPLVSGPDTMAFTTAGGSEAEVPAMGGSLTVPVLDDAGWTGVRLAYQGERLVADVLLPPEGTDPTRVEAQDLSDAVEAMAVADPTQVALTVPTLDLRVTVDATGWLGDAAPSVTGGTGLQGLGGGGVSQVTQQVVLDMNEEGTIAAAVTEIAVERSAPAVPPLSLDINRAYLVRIADTETGLTLFLAAVNDPRS